MKIALKIEKIKKRCLTSFIIKETLDFNFSSIRLAKL